MKTAVAPLPPHSSVAERSTIGALLLDPDRIIDIAPILRPDDFYDPTYRTVYGAITRLYDARKPIDYVSVAEELKSDARMEEIGGDAFLASLSTQVPTSS